MLIFASTAEAATYYVSKQGADANTCAQAQSANMTTKLTISSGVSCLRPGDTLFVKVGLYAEQLSNAIPSGTSWTAPVTVAAYARDIVTIQPPTGANGALTFSTFRGANQAYIVIDGMIVDCVNASGDCVSIQQSAHHIRIKNSEVKNSPMSGVIAGGKDSEFTNLKVHHNNGRGFQFYQPNTVIEGSEIYDNGGSGIYLSLGKGVFLDLEGIDPNNSNTIVRANRIHTNNARTDTSAVMIASGVNIRVFDNVIDSQSEGEIHGIEVHFNVIKARLYDNTIQNHSGYGIVVGASYVRDTVITNNIISSNGRGAINDLGTGTILQNNRIQ
jgi:hypothetical protein